MHHIVEVVTVIRTCVIITPTLMSCASRWWHYDREGHAHVCNQPPGTRSRYELLKKLSVSIWCHIYPPKQPHFQLRLVQSIFLFHLEPDNIYFDI